MKTIALLIVLMFCINLYPQNAFVEGIHATDIAEFKDGETRFSVSGFKVILTGNCQVSYEVNEMWNDKNTITNYEVKTTWNWKDIATIELDLTKNILRLNGRSPMPRTQLNMDTGEQKNEPDNNMVNVYYKNNEMVLKASEWAVQQAKNCGAKVILMN